MVAGLKFLSKKSFHPKNANNQKSVWERQQERDTEEKRIRERERQLQRERDDEELAKARGDAPRLGFMYAAPPGLERGSAQPSRVTNVQADLEPSAGGSTSPAAPKGAHASTTVSSVLTSSQRQPGDDEAAAAFRALLASSAVAPQSHDPGDSDALPSASSQHLDIKASFGTVLHGTTHDPFQAALEKGSKSSQGQSNLSALEKAVGRKAEAAASGSLTLDEQIQRFPALAHAPRAKGISTSHVGVSFKPLGSQIRNVRCLACGVWGHSRGERECSVTGWNPFASTMTTTTTTTVEAATGFASNATNDGTDETAASHFDMADRASTAAVSQAVEDTSNLQTSRQRSRRPRSDDDSRQALHSSSESDSSTDDDDSSRDKKRRRRRHSSRHRKRKSWKRNHHRGRRDSHSDSDESSSRRQHRRRRHRKHRRRERTDRERSEAESRPRQSNPSEGAKST